MKEIAVHLSFVLHPDDCIVHYRWFLHTYVLDSQIIGVSSMVQSLTLIASHISYPAFHAFMQHLGDDA